MNEQKKLGRPRKPAVVEPRPEQPLTPNGKPIGRPRKYNSLEEYKEQVRISNYNRYLKSKMNKLTSSNMEIHLCDCCKTKLI